MASIHFSWRKNGIHIIDLHKTAVKLDETCNALEKITSTGKSSWGSY